MVGVANDGLVDQVAIYRLFITGIRPPPKRRLLIEPTGVENQAQPPVWLVGVQPGSFAEHLRAAGLVRKPIPIRPHLTQLPAIAAFRQGFDAKLGHPAVTAVFGPRHAVVLGIERQVAETVVVLVDLGLQGTYVPQRTDTPLAGQGLRIVNVALQPAETVYVAVQQ